MKYETIIIGGGASALMLAVLLPEKYATVIEHNAATGAKIAVSGGGKCNITNAVMGTEYFLADPAFISHALKQFDEQALLDWLRRQGLEPVMRKESQYFCPHSAKELVSLLQKRSQTQQFLLNECVLNVTEHEDLFCVKTNRRTLYAENVVVASGGLSFPKLGASGIGYEIAEQFGHKVHRTAPALVGFTVQKEQFFFKTLSGASTEVTIDVNGKTCTGSLLFAHKGISGPAVLDASLYWEKGKITIDFLPDFDWQILSKNNKKISSLLPMPKRVTKAFLLQLELEDKAGTAITSKEWQRLQLLKSYAFSPAGTFGYSKAEVTKGGVATDEIDAKTMESKIRKGLFFVGEVLDVTGQLGGYNFQWAFSSAYVCAKCLKKGKRI